MAVPSIASCQPISTAKLGSRSSCFLEPKGLPSISTVGRSTVHTRKRLAKSYISVRSKMVVPGFGEKSPEAKAADSLHNFFTYVAVRVVLSQLQSYNPEGYTELRSFTDSMSLKDGDLFCAALMRESPRHKQLAMRILEVREAYALEDFEWENLQLLSLERMEVGNTKLMREYLMETSRFD